jgi:hypothetical protein
LCQIFSDFLIAISRRSLTVKFVAVLEIYGMCDTGEEHNIITADRKSQFRLLDEIATLND